MAATSHATNTKVGLSIGSPIFRQPMYRAYFFLFFLLELCWFGTVFVYNIVNTKNTIMKETKNNIVVLETDGSQPIDKWLVPQGKKHKIGFTIKK